MSEFERRIAALSQTERDAAADSVHFSSTKKMTLLSTPIFSVCADDGPLEFSRVYRQVRAEKKKQVVEVADWIREGLVLFEVAMDAGHIHFYEQVLISHGGIPLLCIDNPPACAFRETVWIDLMEYRRNLRRNLYMTQAHRWNAAHVVIVLCIILVGVLFLLK